MANNSFDLKNIGVIYLSDLTTQDFPTEQVSTGILGWDGSNLLVKSDSNGPVYTAVPSYKVATGTLALDNSGNSYTAVYNKNLGSMEIRDPNTNTVVPVPYYDISLGDLIIKDSANNKFSPVPVAAQNVAIIGSASANNNAVCVGGVYLKANTTIGAASEAYMSSSGTGSGTLLLVGAGNVIYASWTQNPASASRAGVACVLGQNPTVPVDGWYELLLGVGVNQQQALDTVDVFGLRLVVT